MTQSGMALTGVSDVELAFTAQCDEFVELARQRYPDAPTSIDTVFGTPARVLRPLFIEDVEHLSPAERDELVSSFTSGVGVTHVVPKKWAPPLPGARHPLLALGEQLAAATDFGYEVQHPLEGHPEAVARFGPPDGTLKQYDLVIPTGVDKYREQAETNQSFEAHNDGLGYAGLIKHSILMLDSPPLWGAYNCFQNLVRLAPALAASDADAFRSLFLPDALTALRPRGKGAIQVTTPVFFLGRRGLPQVFFRLNSGEYSMTWRQHPDVLRAANILTKACQTFSPGSFFAHLVRPGETVVINNQHVVHARTPFVDSTETRGRVLARKWYVEELADAEYRHVPGMVIDERYAALFPNQFLGENLVGEWHFDATTRQNVRIA